MTVKRSSSGVIYYLVLAWTFHIAQAQSSLYDTIRNNVNTTKFADLIDSAAMKDALARSSCTGTTQCLTVFVPNNDAVTAMSATLSWDTLALGIKKKIINDHVFEGSKPMTAAEWAQSGVQLNLMNIGFGQGRKNTFALSSIRYAYQTQLSGTSRNFVNSAMLITPDLKASNGMVHVIDRMLYTPQGFLPFFNYLLTQSDTKTSADLWMMVGTNPKFMSLFDPKNGNNDRYATYFVVTDDAWAKVPREKLALLQTNTKLLTEVFSHQYFPNQMVYSQWTALKPQIMLKSGFTTGESSTNTRSAMLNRVSSGQVFINSGLFQAQVKGVGEDISNAVVHKIDSALGFVYENREELIKKLNPNFWQACLTDVSCNTMIQRESQLTFFVPTEAAMARFNSLSANQKTQLLKYMIIPGLISREQMTPFRTIQIDNLDSAIRFRRVGDNIFIEGRLPNQGYVGVLLRSANNVATDGVVHSIDGIPGLAVQTVENYLSQTADFSKYAAYQFVQTQTNGGPFIYLAPTNMALQAMEADTAGVGAQLLQQAERRNYIFRRHSFPILSPLEYLNITQYLVPTANYAFTREELSLMIKVTDNNYRVYTFSFGGASIDVASEVGAYQFTNGILYRLDKLLYVSGDLERKLCYNPACP